MTRRDMGWRVAGFALLLAGCTGSIVGGEASPLTLPCFLAAIAGLVLMVHGRRVGIAWRAERSGHGETAAAIRARRRRRPERD